MGKDGVFSMVGRREMSCSLFRAADAIYSLEEERNERASVSSWQWLERCVFWSSKLKLSHNLIFFFSAWNEA